MAKKRFTDIEKWRDPWYMELPPSVKLLWNYLCDACDNAGVWEMNTKLAEVQIGESVDWDAARCILGDRIAHLDAGRKWHIRRFVEFQYGAVLNPKSPPHAQVIGLLARHGLPHVQVTNGVSHGVGTTPKDKDKDTEEEGDEDARARATPPTTPKPLNETKPGIMELRQIAGLKLMPDDLPAWLDLAAQVGLDVIGRARDEMVAMGRQCWVAETSMVALRIHSERKRDRAERSRLRAKAAEDQESARRVEAERLRLRDEAIHLLEATDLEGCDPTLLRNLRTAIAYSKPGGAFPWVYVKQFTEWAANRHAPPPPNSKTSSTEPSLSPKT